MEKSSMMTKGQMKSFTCPNCGWMIKSPWGENDIVEHVNTHSKNHHPELKMSRNDINKMIK